MLSLWGIEDQLAAPTLLKALTDSSPKVREEATLVVGKLKIADALPRLRKMADVADERHRETVFWSIGEIGTRDDIPLLSLATNHKNSRLRRQAREAIDAITCRSPVNH